MPIVRGTDAGGEPNFVRCSVCGSWLNTDIQSVGGGSADNNEPVTDVDGSTVFRAIVTSTHACWFGGSDNFFVGSRGIGRG